MGIAFVGAASSALVEAEMHPAGGRPGTAPVWQNEDQVTCSAAETTMPGFPPPSGKGPA